MKKNVVLIFLLLTKICSFAQSDTSNAYKNNIQAGIFAPAGVFAIQLEHALSHKISFNTTAEFDYRYFSKDHPIDYSIELMPQLRWYTQKNKTYNQGFYLAVSANCVFHQSYLQGSYNPQKNDIRINSTYIPAGYYYENNIIRQRLSLYAGVGAGYQWLLAKRFIIDLGYSIQYAFIDQERFHNVPVQNQWQKTDYSDIFDYIYFPFQINIGYAF